MELSAQQGFYYYDYDYDMFNGIAFWENVLLSN